MRRSPRWCAATSPASGKATRSTRRNSWRRRGRCTPSAGKRRPGFSGGIGPRLLHGGGVGRRQLGAGFPPDSANFSPGADEKGRRGKRHKGHEQGVFDQILDRKSVV